MLCQKSNQNQTAKELCCLFIFDYEYTKKFKLELELELELVLVSLLVLIRLYCKVYVRVWMLLRRKNKCFRFEFLKHDPTQSN